MLARKTQLLTVAAVLLIPIAVQAQNDTPPEFEFQQVLRTTIPITLDGDISEEEWGHANLIINPTFNIPKFSGQGGTLVIHEPLSGTWSGEEDQSSRMRFLFDGENLYTSFVVVDDFHENGANSPWNGDSAQIMIADSDRESQVGLYNFALGGVNDDPDFFPVCGPQLPDNLCTVQFETGPAGVDVGPDGINAAILRGDGLTNYEIMLSAAALGIEETLEIGQQYGFGVAINDGDDDVTGQGGWVGLGAHAIVFGKDPSETVVLVLDDVPPPDDWPGDANGDGHTDVDDLNILGLNWRQQVNGGRADADFDLNGFVDAADLNEIGTNWQTWAPMPAAVPEPGTFLLAACGLLLLLIKRRR